MIQLLITILTLPATEKFLGTLALHCLSKLALKTTNKVDDELVSAVEEALSPKGETLNGKDP